MREVKVKKEEKKYSEKKRKKNRRNEEIGKEREWEKRKK